MVSIQDFSQKALGSLGITHGTQAKLQGLPLGIHGSIQVHPDTLDFQMRATSFLQFGCVSLDPAVNGGMINMPP